MVLEFVKVATFTKETNSTNRYTTMEETKKITLLGVVYEVLPFGSRYLCGFETDQYKIHAYDLLDRIESYNDANLLVREITSFIYDEALNECEEQAKSGDLLYSDKELIIFTQGEGIISARAMYCEVEETSSISLSASFDRLDEEDEEGDDIDENIEFNETADLIESFEFNRKMNPDEKTSFWDLEEASHENFHLLNPEE